MTERDFKSGHFDFSLDVEGEDYEFDPFADDDPFVVPSLESRKQRVIRPGDLFRNPGTPELKSNSAKADNAQNSSARHGKLNWTFDW